MPCCKQNKIPAYYHIFKAGKWLQLIDGGVKEPGKRYATRLEFTYRTNDSFTLIPFNKVVKALKSPTNGFTNNENRLVKSSFARKYKNLQRKNRRFVRQMAEMKRKLQLLERQSRKKTKRDSSCSKTSDSHTTSNSCSAESTLDRKIINKIKNLTSLYKGKKKEIGIIENTNKSETLQNEKENELQKPNNKNVETIKEVIILNETIEMLTRFASKHPEFLERIDKSWVRQEGVFQKDEDLLSFLYKVNPLVNVENMNLLETVMKNNISNVILTNGQEEEDLIALEDFAAKLGLVDVRKSNVLKQIHETRRSRTCKESDDTKIDRSTNSVSPMDRLARKQKGPFRSEKEKAIADSLSKNTNNNKNKRSRNEKLRKKQPINYRVISSNSDSSVDSDNVRKKAKLSNENTPITNCIIKFRTHLEKITSVNSNTHNEKQDNDIVLGKLFEKTPYDENCDYLKNLQKDLRNVRKKQVTSEIEPLSGCATSSPIKRPDLDRVRLSDPSTTVDRVADIESKQLKKILRENNKIAKVQSDLDAINVYSESYDKTDAENILRTGKRSQRSQMVSYLENHPSKPYSMAEDTIILNFILTNGYENKVKGNVIWKELEECYGEMSLERRTWQSLKNRYLRTVIKNLKDYSLQPEQERKIRIASCLGSGVIKVKMNSLSPVSSAWNAGRRKKLKNSDELLKKATKVLKTNNAKAPEAGPSSSTQRSKRIRSDYPTYTQTIKKFSNDHTYSNSDSSIDEKVTKSSKLTRKKLYTAVVH